MSLKKPTKKQLQVLEDTQMMQLMQNHINFVLEWPSDSLVRDPFSCSLFLHFTKRFKYEVKPNLNSYALEC